MEKKRVLLISPPFYRLMGSHFNSIPLGISYIAAVLNKNGHHAVIYNADYEHRREYANQRQIFDGYDTYKKILYDFNHPIWHNIKNTIEKFKPDIVGISTLTGTFKSAMNIAKITKEINKNIVVIVGGVHPTILPDECIKSDYVDYVVVGEGEFVLLDLLNGKKMEEIKGLVYKKNGKIINNERREYISNLDSLPFPEREAHIIPPADPNEYGGVITGRGCVHACTFCASKKLWGRSVRFRSVENVFEEIKTIYDKYKTRFFEFRDDTLTLNIPRAKKLFRMIIDSGINIQWTCDTRVDSIDKEVLVLMKRAGCIRVKIGAESGSQRILDKVKKGITIEQIRHAVTLIKEAGLEFTLYLMIGFPTETEEEVQKTLELAKELNPNYYSLSVLAPYYGTEIYDEFVKNRQNNLKEKWEFFFHQSKDMILTSGIKNSTVDEFLSLNERNGKIRK
jgi:radical SAM superfamily enzyme YgiQ (UPF0313 family)